jgi:hypothetical protein
MVNRYIINLTDYLDNGQIPTDFTSAAHLEIFQIMLGYFLLRTTTHALALLLGGCGIFFLWVSFSAPALAGYAIVFLTAATAITLGLPRAEA